MKNFFNIPKTAVLLGLTSLLNDIASESIYPLMPVFLSTVIGAQMTFIGVLEGLAESIASLLKVYAGRLSDQVGQRHRFVVVGYLISNIARPMTSIIQTPFHALLVRIMDRVGKGIRSAPRDAWLGLIASKSDRAQVFGFHRAMDNLGAMIGPLLASAYLYVYPNDFRTLFALTAIPGILTLLITRKAARDGVQTALHPESKTIKKPFISAFKDMPADFKKYLLILALFTLSNSSDAFLLLRMKEAGMQAYQITLLWTLLHLVKVVANLKAGKLSDLIGHKTAIAIGWTIYGAIYISMGYFQSIPVLITCFLIYGIYSGFTEAPEKALVADMVDKGLLGSAFGIFHFIVGVCIFPASLFAGLMWDKISMSAYFYSAGITALISALLISRLNRTDNQSLST